MLYHDFSFSMLFFFFFFSSSRRHTRYWRYWSSDVCSSDLVDARLLDVDDLAADRQDRLEHRVAAGLGRATGRVALDDVDLGVARVGRAAVGQLAGQAGRVERVLARQLAGLLGGAAGARGRAGLGDDLLGLGRGGLEPVRELGVAEIGRAHL